MPRRARITVAGVPHHVVQRGHNREATFFADEDYLAYRHSLKEGAQRYRCAIHAYALMTNHVHLLVTPASEDGLSRLMRHLGSRYVQGTIGDRPRFPGKREQPYASATYAAERLT